MSEIILIYSEYYVSSETGFIGLLDQGYGRTMSENQSEWDWVIVNISKDSYLLELALEKAEHALKENTYPNLNSNCRGRL
ncbi:hypothetical protein ACFWGC_29825 [Cytobacillus pseudoceanisediminis]|uniref:hypothetical protein n=1 Tax=Cytobacillus pseudoceanisediminis TaxID=3051614 RepID=UPI0036587DFD